MQGRGCDLCVLWFSFVIVLCRLSGGGCIKEIRFVLQKFALSLSVLESQAGKIQGRSLQEGVFVVENYVPSWQ